MKAKIDENGHLMVERKGQWVECMCPIMTVSMGRDCEICNHQCPLFIEETDCRGDPTVLLGCAPQVIVHEIVADERVPALEPGKTEEGA